MSAVLEVQDVESTGGQPSDKWPRGDGVCVLVVLARRPGKGEEKELHVGPIGKEEREVEGEACRGLADTPHCKANCLLDLGGVCQCGLTLTGVDSLSKCDTIISRWPEGAFSHCKRRVPFGQTI